MSQLAQDLLQQARSLARADARRPRAANVRRAISSAYYALFHHLLESGAELLVGTQPTDWPFVALTARGFDHRTMKAACLAFTQQPPAIVRPLWLSLGGPSNPELQLVARTLIDVQERRHAADYDLMRTFTRTEALAAVRQAQDAIDAWGAAATGCP